MSSEDISEGKTKNVFLSSVYIPVRDAESKHCKWACCMVLKVVSSMKEMKASKEYQVQADLFV